MPAQWLRSSSDVTGRASAALDGVLQGMAQPEQARRLRQGILLLLSLWAVLALARLVWALLPQGDAAAGPPPDAINPVSSSQAGPEVAAIDIQRMRDWHLFGEAGAVVTPVAQAEPAPAASARDGIEKGARKTRLAVTLRGIVASTDDGLGHAIIEHKSKQAVYAVGDKLPVSGNVTLAKVLPTQVVLDNGGTYELLELFDKSKIGTQRTATRYTPPAPRQQPRESTGQQIDKRGDAGTTALASQYRERLYKDPQSLVKVVNVSAVRDGDQLLGYRIRPGQEREQFEQLGFKTGDMVTAVNGISLDNPANTMSLYNAMRSAGEVTFELERDGQPLSISVNLEAGGQ